MPRAAYVRHSIHGYSCRWWSAVVIAWRVWQDVHALIVIRCRRWIWRCLEIDHQICWRVTRMLTSMRTARIVVTSRRLIVAGWFSRIVARHCRIPSAISSMLAVAWTRAHHPLMCWTHLPHHATHFLLGLLRSKSVVVLDIIRSATCCSLQILWSRCIKNDRRHGIIRHFRGVSWADVLVEIRSTHSILNTVGEGLAVNDQINKACSILS